MARTEEVVLPEPEVDAAGETEDVDGEGMTDDCGPGQAC